MVNHPNRKQSALRLSKSERTMLLDVLREAIATLEAADRSAYVLRSILRKLSDLGD
jgi:hypothetical protein